MYYKKNKNNKLFEAFDKTENGALRKMQNYIPLYDRFFSLNDTNWNSINLNHERQIKNIVSCSSQNQYVFSLQNGDEVDSFVKLVPIFDPVKYMTGSYKDVSYNGVPSTDLIPRFGEKQWSKIDDPNNVAYTDGFFFYLSNLLRTKYHFPHGLEFYGSYLGVKDEFTFDVVDDIEFLHDSDYFIDHVGKDFSIDHEDLSEMMGLQRTRKCKAHLSIKSGVSDLKFDNIDSDVFASVFDDDNEGSDQDKVATGANVCTLDEVKDLMDEIYLQERKNQEGGNTLASKRGSDDTSTCSSRTSNTSASGEQSDGDDIDIENNTSVNGDKDRREKIRELLDSMSQTTGRTGDTKTGSLDDASKSGSNGSDGYSIDSEDPILATLHNIPVHFIAIEKLEMTLDEYMSNFDVEPHEWLCIFMQIIMTLLTYQKVFDFTHNDLHTNNIMFVTTEKEYLYYKYGGTCWKVKTYGKLFKIIDFGRAIYKFKKRLLCSDSYGKDGDAVTQFNFGPYHDTSKQTVEPHFAFDLCRFGCSLYDYFQDRVEGGYDKDGEKDEFGIVPRKKKGVSNDDLLDIVEQWCTDDKGNNILYKRNGKERYPGFKLYKMISRTVTKPTPNQQLKRSVFKEFQSQMRFINKKELVDIDTMQSLR